MSQWLSPRRHLMFAVFVTISVVVGGNIDALNVCGPDTSDETSSSLVFVSTLDGNLLALDLNKNGEKKWSVDFEDKPMLSSSIHKRELNNDGHWVRLIPSLSGGLYKFDGENLESLQVTPQQLLRSSFRYSDDLVLSGSGETRTWGISSTTGKILYHCNEGSCTNMTGNESYLGHHVLIVRRFQDTIRAAEPRTGQERWNYSVGQHDLELIPNDNQKCNSKLLQHIENIELRVNIPEGLIWAINKTNPGIKLWQQKVESPIVSVWREHGEQNEIEKEGNISKLTALNLFESTKSTWGNEYAVSPDIYVGMHDRQLYIQENVKHIKLIARTTEASRIYPWRPYPASDTALVLHQEENSLSTALSVLYNSDYINGNGFYLHSKEILQQEDSSQCNKTQVPLLEASPSESRDDLDSEETPVQVIIVSLWYWWKEVLIISFSTAILLNFMLTQRLLNATTPVKDAVAPPLIVERPLIPKENIPKPLPSLESSGEFVSRYLTDFDPVDCLGKGGYGVVFEARKKIDHVNYAVKRITLPNNEDARERVMREVRALANLDHQNIVRYFHAWLECPPAGWKEEHDEMYINRQNFSPSEFPSEISMTPSKPNASVCIDLPNSEKSSVDSAFEALELNKNNDDSSFIIFDERSDESAVTEELYDSAGITETSESINHREDENFESREDSESIVFQNTCSSHEIDNREMNKRKASLSLNLAQKSSKKIPRMFLYIQMQLCHRESLREWMKRQTHSRNPDNVENIFQQIVDGVEYVHLHGLIHRDLKPSNIFFSYDKKVKIGDFGLATAMTEEWQEPRTPNGGEGEGLGNGLHTAHVGTHLYMAPEQMNGQVYNYKVDIYSLGIILFELLTPFGTDMERMMAILDLRKAIFPGGFGDKHPRAIDLLRMMLAENPGKRPTTLGIKARPPLAKNEWRVEGVGDESKWHFDLPQISRHSSVNTSSSGESWDISTS
ncbi:eukaryotic translation initiation factor 2-alpha kinase [Fopius arisanus]|uniref:non-specific serine/threonine protein kinase n=1 Tax=Fopius arisanus TaxID=64838 RepID=A0A0C9R3F0_9HYME|nr:PREDICTED: eukaryotic translation initiation factor 2-alpha kinase [Fopius arisanus]